MASDAYEVRRRAPSRGGAVARSGRPLGAGDARARARASDRAARADHGPLSPSQGSAKADGEGKAEGVDRVDEVCTRARARRRRRRRCSPASSPRALTPFAPARARAAQSGEATPLTARALEMTTIQMKHSMMNAIGYKQYP